MDERAASWHQLQIRRAALAAGELMHTLSDRRNPRMATELARLRREAELAMDRFQAANEADGELEEEPGHLAACDFNGCEVSELFEASHELGADYAGCKACRACINATLEERESSGECRDYDEEMGVVR